MKIKNLSWNEVLNFAQQGRMIKREQWIYSIILDKEFFKWCNDNNMCNLNIFDYNAQDWMVTDYDFYLKDKILHAGNLNHVIQITDIQNAIDLFNKTINDEKNKLILSTNNTDILKGLDLAQTIFNKRFTL